MVRRVWAQLRKLWLRLRIGNTWKDGDGLGHRRYPDYGSYLTHQRLKLDALRATSLEGHAERFHAALRERLGHTPVDLAGRSVLCLAAREGAEVRAFVDRGAFAVGLDLNPGRANRFVVVGDFHQLQYADHSVDVVYTNSLDHVLELDRVLTEVRRVLKPAGWFLIEVGMGTAAGSGRGFYETLSWPHAEEIVARLAQAGFTPEHRLPFEVPWRGLQVALRKSRD